MIHDLNIHRAGYHQKLLKEVMVNVGPRAVELREMKKLL